MLVLTRQSSPFLWVEFFIFSLQFYENSGIIRTNIREQRFAGEELSWMIQILMTCITK